MQKAFPNSTIISGNTDSIAIAVNYSGVEYLNRLSTLADIFDFTNLVGQHAAFTENNKNRPGSWRIIADKITQFVAVGPSTYSYRTVTILIYISGN